MSTKADCQTAQTAAEAALVNVQRQADPKQSNGPDTLGHRLATLATAVAAVRTQIDALP